MPFKKDDDTSPENEDSRTTAFFRALHSTLSKKNHIELVVIPEEVKPTPPPVVQVVVSPPSSPTKKVPLPTDPVERFEVLLLKLKARFELHLPGWVTADNQPLSARSKLDLIEYLTGFARAISGDWSMGAIRVRRTHDYDVCVEKIFGSEKNFLQFIKTIEALESNKPIFLQEQKEEEAEELEYQRRKKEEKEEREREEARFVEQMLRTAPIADILSEKCHRL